jgi:hypothetical protein
MIYDLLPCRKLAVKGGRGAFGQNAVISQVFVNMSLAPRDTPYYNKKDKRK